MAKASALNTQYSFCMLQRQNLKEFCDRLPVLRSQIFKRIGIGLNARTCSGSRRDVDCTLLTRSVEAITRTLIALEDVFEGTLRKEPEKISDDSI